MDFKITRGKGFHITFASGFTVSVQFGPGNYGDNYNARISEDSAACGERGSDRAEVAIWGADGGMVELPGGDSVAGYQTSNQVLDYINAAASSDPHKYLADKIRA